MLNFFSILFSKIGNYFLSFSYLLNKAGKTDDEKIHAKEIALWWENKGNETHRLNYDLDGKSVVFDLGGFEGQWASDIFSKYVCSIYIFEPYEIFAKNIEQRFKKNDSIKVFPLALAHHNGNASFLVSSDDSSMYIKSDKTVPIKLIKASEFIAQNQILKIDLLKINIEGSEYDLLDHLIDSGTILIIENIQVQFHNFYPDALNRMLKIHKSLMITHELTWQYKFVWENWQKKKS